MNIKPMKIIPLKLEPLIPIKNLSTPESKANLPKTFTIKPLVPMTSFQSTSHFSSTKSKGVLPDAGNQPDPTQCQIEHFQQNREQIVGKVVKQSLHKHPQDVLHGSRSLNILLPHYSRTPGDWDMFSPTEKQRAIAIEASIDKAVGADIVETRYNPVPKVSMGPDDPTTSKELYRVVSKHTPQESEVDVMDRPKQLKTIHHKGITHESLDSAYQKARTRMTRQPMKAQKALQDSRSIEEFYKQKGLNLPLEEKHPMMWRRI